MYKEVENFILNDAANLIMCHVKRKSRIAKRNQQKMEVALRQHVQDVLQRPHLEHSSHEG